MISRRLTPEEHNAMIKAANRQYWIDGAAWLEQELKRLNEEGK